MSSDVQRLIRKLRPKGPRSFDEQVWPLYVAIVVLFGYLAGLTVSLLRFDDARLHANATTWLIVLSILAAGGILGVRFLEHELLKRTVVLSLLLSLIVNVSMVIVMAWTSILSHPWQEPETTVAVRERPEEVVIPEYPIFDTDPRQRVPQEYERPVETGELEAQERVELTRQSATSVVEQTERPPLPPSSTPRFHPNLAESTRFEPPSAPRQSKSLAKLTRQSRSPSLTLNRSTLVPSTSSSPPSPTANPVQPNEALTQASKQALTPQRPATAEALEPTSPSVDVAAFSRKSPDRPSSEAASEDLASLPTLQRPFMQSRKLPSTTTPVDDRLTLPERTDAEVHATKAFVQRQTVTSSPEQMTNVDLQPRIAVDLQRQTRLNAPESASLSRFQQRATLTRASRSATDVDRPNVSSELSTEPLNPSLSQLTQPTQNDAVPGREAMMEPQPTEYRQPSPSTLARAQAQSEASVSEILAPARSLSRSRKRDHLATQPNTQVDSLLSADSNMAHSTPVPDPSRMALSRSAIGIAGVGDAANLERGAAAPESPVLTASAAANRAEAEQEQPEAFAISPSSRTLVRQMRATAHHAQSSMLAQNIDSAMVAGATEPAEVATSTAATVEHAPSNARQSSLTGAQGTTEVDLGSTRIAADTGRGRAEGGGQPEINTGELPRALPRSQAIAGAAGLRTSTEVPRSPAAQDHASRADSVGMVVHASSSTLTHASHAQASLGANMRSGQPAAQPQSPTLLATTGAARAESDDDFSANAIPIGGTLKTGNQTRGLQISTDTASDIPALASTDGSAGVVGGESLDAQGTRATQSATGLPARSDEIVEANEIVEAVEVELVRDGRPEAMRSELDVSRYGDGSEVAESNRAVADIRKFAPRKTRHAALSGSETNVQLDPEELAVNVPFTNTDEPLATPVPLTSTTATTQGMQATIDNPSAIARSAGGVLPVEIDAPEGLGGLGHELAADTGIPTRRAHVESDFVSVRPARFLNRTPSVASVASSTEVVTPTKAYRRRIVRRGEALAGERGLPSPKTEAAIELGLVFLARYQSADGSWSFNNFADGKTELPDGEEALIISDSAATGLSLLSFLGAGYHHKADKYQEHVKNGIDFLVQHQQPDGDLYIDQDTNSSRSAWLYSHAIATIALCEAYGMTQDPALRGPAQKAVNFVEESQHPTRGGWRYSPAYGADTSVTGWMTMALKSAELAGLSVDSTAFDRVKHWMELAQVSDAQPFLFRYNPYAADTDTQRHGRQPTRAMTAVGLLMRMYTGWRRDDANMVAGAKTLEQNLPQIGTSDRPQRDTYYWYYATQVMFHMGGEQWQRWNQALHPMLTGGQIQEGPLAGSWDPQMPVRDRWGVYGGRLYVTTMNLLSLEIFYRHLPIYEETSK